MLDIKGCIVTLNAMGCQTHIAAQVINQGGDYSLGLKGNQESLHEAVKDYFDTAKAADFKDVKYDYSEEIDNVLNTLPITMAWAKTMTWKGLNPVVKLLETTYQKGVKIDIIRINVETEFVDICLKRHHYWPN